MIYTVPSLVFELSGIMCVMVLCFHCDPCVHLARGHEQTCQYLANGRREIIKVPRCSTSLVALRDIYFCQIYHLHANSFQACLPMTMVLVFFVTLTQHQSTTLLEPQIR